MYRSWAYILMVLATLVGGVALLWPSPRVYVIDDGAAVAVARPAAPAKADTAPARPAKGAGKAATKPAAPPAPEVVKKIPPQTTLSQRLAPKVPNGMAPSPFATRPGVVPAPPSRPPGGPGGYPRPPGTPPRPVPSPSRPGPSSHK